MRLALLALAALPLLTACDWFTEFKSQPRIEAWEPVSQRDDDTTHAPRGQPQNSVPITGTFVAGYQVSYNALPNVIDSMSTLANPTPVSPASLANGRKYYQINCAVCHGDTGAGNGPATKYGMAGISLLTPITQGRTDGYIWGMMRNGRGLMPTYNRIEEMDRWDVVNYVRALQGKAQNTAGIGPVGWPGQNGNTLPGPTATAPTRPAPFWREPRGAPGTPNTATPQPAPELPTPAAPGGAPATPNAAPNATPNATPNAAPADSTSTKGRTP